MVRTVFLPMEGEREFSLNEKSDLFFHDYSMASLFVQENYLNARPQSSRYTVTTISIYLVKIFVVHISRGNIVATLRCISKAADSLCDGDLVEHKIRSSSYWGLLPLQV